jgi:hypothetical protein
MGVGGDNSWGALTHPEYRLPAQHYNYGYTVSPISGAVVGDSALANQGL